ncbi:MAG: type II secretion system F family protein [Azoarcus sp.]|jgi:type IV pilus assembly protein PilC|nr:type II secretion system F family protein [Azoarcus sp.]
MSSRFRYRACDAHGHIVRGELDAEHAAELEAHLRTRGLEALHIEARPARVRVWPGAGRMPRRELIHFCFHLEQMFSAGVPILDALADFAAAPEAHAGMRAIAADLRAGIERGQPLSEAMNAHPRTFDEVFRGLLRAGEATGDLAPALRQIAADLTRADELRAQARKAAIYPLAVGAVLSIAVAVALTQVVPQVATLFRGNGATLPHSTRALIATADWLAAYGWSLPLAYAASAASIATAAARHEGFRLRLHALSLRLPLVGPIRRRLALARTASLFAMLYASGITVIDALASAARATPNLLIRTGIEAAGAHIAAGQGIANAFESTGLFPPLVTRMLKVGEQTGRLDHALGQLAYFYERDARDAIERLQASIEPALTVLMGLLMLWIALAVLCPIYDIITSLPL